MDGTSLNIIQEKIKRLKELFPEAVSEDKIDWERLRATLGEEAIISNERYFQLQNVINKELLKTNTLLQFKDAGVDFRTV